MSEFPVRRLRRLRGSRTMRELLAEVRLGREDLVAPLFVRAGTGVRREIAAMPGQYQHSVDTAMETVNRWAEAGISAVLLFGIPEKKDETGSGGWDSKGPVPQLVRAIKAKRAEMLVIADVCLCEYTSHGHCGQLVRRDDGTADVDNDATLPHLAAEAVCYAEAGADVVAPSAMMDGQVAAIRAALDKAGHSGTAIMAYAAKFASSLYGPFREAAESTPSMGDRRGYQMDYRCGRQALLEAAADEAEGADILMVKPAGAYLDVLARLRERTLLPLAAYQVSGEYAAIKAAGAHGWLDEAGAAMEVTTAIKRAGADLIITYFAEMLAKRL